MLYAGLPDVMAEAALGSRATPALLLTILAVTVLGVGLAWRGAAGPLPKIVAVVLFVAAGLTAGVGIALLFDGVLAVLSILMLYSALCIAMIGREVVTRSRRGSGGVRG